MPSHNNKRLVLIGMLVSAALVLGYFERLIPMNFSFPGIKLGLANIITLMAVYMFGFREVMTIVLLRVAMTAFFAGTGVSFLYSLSGGMLSFLAMYLLVRFFRRHFSMVGVSVFGAAFHNLGQALVLGVLTGSLAVPLHLLPYLLVAGTATGLLTGFTALYFYNHVQKLPSRLFK
ncbi:Gx transporter family protein [Anaerotalea alkaliphila]|uniref:Gx transporter family protein n=1 Tax=Anaerotalea alkaliphila TaxID=2662126 RepID=A0A7X5HV56_9FIRM|nr:Gx transporter family protein [Anaerotalea alkaliphila]NDL67213.1 Gx transporter family protein [Anaerotalea alkaliphila]